MLVIVGLMTLPVPSAMGQAQPLSAVVQDEAAAQFTFEEVKSALEAGDLAQLQNMAAVGTFHRDSLDGIPMQDIMMLAAMTDREEIFEIVLNPYNLQLRQTIRGYTGTFLHYVWMGERRAGYHYTAFFRFGKYSYTGNLGFFAALLGRAKKMGAPLDALDSTGRTPSEAANYQDELLLAEAERSAAGLARGKAKRDAANRELTERLNRQAAAGRAEAEERRRRDERMMGDLFAQRDALIASGQRRAEQDAAFEQSYRQSLNEEQVAASRAQQAQAAGHAVESNAADPAQTGNASAPAQNRSTGNGGQSAPSRSQASATSASTLTPRPIVWKGDELLACKKTARLTRTTNPDEDRGDAVKAFELGCELVHKMKYSTSGSNSLYCGKSGEFGQDLAEKLGEAGLAPYQSYGQRAWNAWKENVGCL